MKSVKSVLTLFIPNKSKSLYLEKKKKKLKKERKMIKKKKTK